LEPLVLYMVCIVRRWLSLHQGQALAAAESLGVV